MASWEEPGVVTEPESREECGDCRQSPSAEPPQKQPPGVDLSCGASHRTCGFRPDLQPGHCLRPSVPIPGTWEPCTVSVGRSPCLQRPQSPHLGLLNQNFQPTWCLAGMRRDGCTAAPCWPPESQPTAASDFPSQPGRGAVSRNRPAGGLIS